MYQRLQRGVFDAKSMLTLAKVAVAAIPGRVELEQPAVVGVVPRAPTAVVRHEPVRLVVQRVGLVLAILVILGVFIVVITRLTVTESALTE